MGIIEDRKATFISVFSKAPRFTWPSVMKQNYLRTLINTHKLKRGELPIGLALADDPVVILSTVEPFDQELSIFVSWHSAYEALGNKNYALFALPELPLEDTLSILKERVQPYDLSQSESWTLAGISVSGPVTEVVYAKVAQKQRTVSLGLGNLPTDLRTALEQVAKKRGSDSDILVDIKASIISRKRSIMTVRLDTETRCLEVGNDVFEADDTGSRLGASKIESDRREGLKKLCEDLELSPEGTRLLMSAKSSPIITSKTTQGLLGLNTPHLVVVRTMEKFDVKNATEHRLNEVVESDLPNQDLSEIKAEATRHFDEFGTFEGFFMDNIHRKAEDAETIARLKAAGTPTIGFRAYVVSVGPKPDFLIEDNVDEESPGHMHNRQVEFVQIELEPTRGEVEVRNGQYSQRAQRVFFDQILALAHEPKPQPATAGKSFENADPEPAK